ncbi:hypothetical protein NLC26_00365 [Candidatus Aminicenantes bacterium AC-708-M15]|jgi:hypothetical protein|nr:hypothetical protein [SCandidatus Aminicenantes bacterium Aminicenantia_JdfR_composite]MCP2596518.1 hypothetical protein [Candidatus Aminicenantes bacterium AC-335-G13]MCP2598723.1 hypothetical protein [Candidatus Aminicenantes bacterium AC-335-L06]MCP2603915.1 hypothetical protein [Candidatus Aminicenantes bacterium AC-708-M15]MCP2618112.1 hypothetical protein [Candidatus Aminicenantes bacterium AC-335-A11]
MKLKAVLIIKSIVCIGFGLPLLIIPEKLVSLLDVTISPGGAFFAREYGGALVGLFFLFFLAINSEASKALKAIVFFGFLYDLINFFVSLFVNLSGLMNFLGWSIVAVYFIFTLGFGYFLLKNPNEW